MNNLGEGTGFWFDLWLAELALVPQPILAKGKSGLPALTINEQVLLSVSTSTVAQMAAFPNNRRHPIPLQQLIQQATSDRLGLAGEHLMTADTLVLAGQFRSSISRHYYAMYHAARAIVFADVGGDDHERHAVLSANLPSNFPDRVSRAAELTDARALRNEADYDLYPLSQTDWEQDARALAPVAAAFVAACEQFAIQNGQV